MSESITIKRINEVKGNLSQESFAKKIKSSQPVVCKILKGEQPSINVLLGISKAFNVSVDWLLGTSSRKYLSGYSSYTEEKPLTYADTIGFLVTLMKKDSISYVRSAEIQSSYETKFYSGAPFPETQSDTLFINDSYIGELLYAANSLLKCNPESIDAWLKKNVEDYDVPVINWSPSENLVFSNCREYQTPLEILNARLDELSKHLEK